MKLRMTSSLIVACGVLSMSMLPSQVAATAVAFPVQTYFVPLPEELVLDGVFKVLHKRAVTRNGPYPSVVTLLSATISIDNTVIFYDHHEDGFEADVVRSSQASTEIWGDGNAANGCAPGTVPCTDATDILKTGSAIVIQNEVPMPRNNSQFMYDGGDRIQASFPIAVTRGAYPVDPGSLMAGAVEVLETTLWGTEYTAPVGPEFVTDTDAFEHTVIFVMAGEDDTIVTHAGANYTLGMGESIALQVHQNDKIVATKPVQADLLTGDIGDNYELRWFSLTPEEYWSNDYLSPVGDTQGETRVFCFNPHNESITVSYQYHDGTNVVSAEMEIDAFKGSSTDFIPTHSAAHLSSTSTFLALSVTDTRHGGKADRERSGQFVCALCVFLFQSLIPSLS
jgi:hypothetical protein